MSGCHRSSSVRRRQVRQPPVRGVGADGDERTVVAAVDPGQVRVQAGRVRPGADVVGPVGAHHQQVAAWQDRLEVAGAGDAGPLRGDGNVAIGPAQPVAGGIDLEPANVGLGVQGLPVEVGQLHPVVIDQVQASHAGGGERGRGGASGAADTDDDHLRRAQDVWRSDDLHPAAYEAISSIREHTAAFSSGPPVHDDLVRRNFTADAPNRLWLADITEHATGDGKLYLCAIKDVFSNRIVGYSIDARMKSRLAVAALDNAAARREHVDGCILRSDRGSQFRSRKFVRALDRHRMAGSIGRVGAAGDNAAMESFFSLLQKNVLDRRSWATREELRIAIVTWIERTYHRRRRQAALGRLTPIEFETVMTTPALQAA